MLRPVQTGSHLTRQDNVHILSWFVLKRSRTVNTNKNTNKAAEQKKKKNISQVKKKTKQTHEVIQIQWSLLKCAIETKKMEEGESDASDIMSKKEYRVTLYSTTVVMRRINQPSVKPRRGDEVHSDADRNVSWRAWRSRKSLLTQICSFQVLLNVSFINSAQLFSYRCSAAAACFSCTSRGRYIKLNSVITPHRIAESLGLMNSLQFSWHTNFTVVVCLVVCTCAGCTCGSFIYECFLFLAPCVVCLHYVKRCIPTVSLYTDVLTIKLQVLNENSRCAWRRTQSVQPATVRWSWCFHRLKRAVWVFIEDNFPTTGTSLADEFSHLDPDH